MGCASWTRQMLRTLERNGTVLVETEESGHGRPREEIRDKIFEPFFTTKQAGKGRGLGLSISYGSVQDYEGTIKASTGGEGGALITVTFPVPAEDA
ncbi:ATP-binding protein [Thermodesulfobacteriota bacterium]